MVRAARVVGIHVQPGSFSDGWLSRAATLGDTVEALDCFDTSIVSRLARCDVLLWHWTHMSRAARLVARPVIRAAEELGVRVFPSSDTCWHFDDKLAQKYLLEAIGAPLATTHAFLDESRAIEWCRTATFPLVFKLRAGAGSSNVVLVRSRRQAVRLVQRAFRSGFPSVSGYSADLGTRVGKARSAGRLWAAMKRSPRTFLEVRRARRTAPMESGYVLFQEFLPGNTSDTRVTVIGERAFAFQRGVRPGDFRASGSGRVSYDTDRIDPRCIRIAFDVAKRLRAQSLAFDFVFDSAGEPRIIEISYTYLPEAVHDCPGHWDRAMAWHEGHAWPQDAIYDDVVHRSSR